jgi:phytanoyl-CoA hydroxylase
MSLSMATEAALDFSQEVPAHAPELYQPVGVVESIHTLDAFDEIALAQYHRDGFVAIEDAFTAQEVGDAKEALNDLIMGKIEGYNGIQYESKSRDLLPTLSLENRMDAVRRFWGFVDFDPRLGAMARNPKLMRIVEMIVGDMPVLFQNMALIKPPRIGVEKPWHQDQAYFDYPIGTRIVGVWIALDAATVENGCMRVLPGLHREGPLRPGGLLLFDGLLPHGTPTNSSPNRRRAVQFHYLNQSAQKTSCEERLAIFGSEGKDVSC